MSDHLPLEMQVKIMKRLPVKSLIQCRSVSKAWKSLIDSPEFISAHSVYHSHSHRLLFECGKSCTTDKIYVSVLDDDTFPGQKLDLTVSLSVKRLNDSEVIGSSHGLICLSGYYAFSGDSLRFKTTKVVVLWNPSIRKSIAINLPNLSSSETVFGFGVCSVTRDPKILLASYESCNTGQLNVFTLSSSAWQSIDITLLFSWPKWIRSQAVVDGFIYWLVSYRISVEGVDRTHSLIVSFDLATDEFNEVYLPESLELKPAKNLSVNKFRDSLAVIDFCFDDECCDVWKMEDGSSNVFIKFFTFKFPNSYINGLMGFNRIGDPILEMLTFFPPNQATLGFYNRFSKRICYSWIFGCVFILSVYSYTETLLLLNRKEFGYCFDINVVENDDFVLSTMDWLSVE